MALIAAQLNAGHSGGDTVAISILSPPFSPSLINLTVSVDVKHHVYFKLLSSTVKDALASPLAPLLSSLFSLSLPPHPPTPTHAPILLSSLGGQRPLPCLPWKRLAVWKRP